MPQIPNTHIGCGCSPAECHDHLELKLLGVWELRDSSRFVLDCTRQAPKFNFYYGDQNGWTKVRESEEKTRIWRMPHCKFSLGRKGGLAFCWKNKSEVKVELFAGSKDIFQHGILAITPIGCLQDYMGTKNKQMPCYLGPLHDLKRIWMEVSRPLEGRH